MAKEKNILYIKEIELDPSEYAQTLVIFGMSRLLSIGDNKGKPIVRFLINSKQNTSFTVDFLIVGNEDPISTDWKYIDTLYLDSKIHHIFTTGWYPGQLW